jgi:quercetin dioxygenase-like cupin family protein
MRDRRAFLQTGFLSLGALVAATSPAGVPARASMESRYRLDLPPVNLAGWQLNVLELTFPPNTTAPKHRHPAGFVLGYVLEGDFRFHLEGEGEQVLSTGEVFYEPPGSIHLPSGSASMARQARVLALSFGEKGKALTESL